MICLLGLSLDHAPILGELFSSKHGLLESPRSLTLGTLQGYYHRHARNPTIWAEVTTLCFDNAMLCFDNGLL